MYENVLKKWFVVQIKSNSYDLAIRNLERQGHETFVPKMKVTVKKKKSFVDKFVSVFPGYLFVGVDTENINLTKINSTYGVSKLLVFNKNPYEISQDMVLALKKRYSSNFSRNNKDKLQEGDFIKFESGPFVELIARIEAVDGKNRLWVLLDLLGSNRKIKIKQTKKISFTKV